MITKEDLRKKMEELLKSVKPSDLQEISQKMSEFLKFTLENYDNLSPEAKNIYDNMMEKIQNFAFEALIKMPESKEKRQLNRLYNKSLGEHYDVEQFIEALEAPPQLKEENSKEFRKIFITRTQNIIDILFDVSQNTLGGADKFGQFSLLYMCVDELLAAFHLAQHYFINQAYSHIRTIFEHLDKVELFRTKPEWAEIWAGDDEEKIRKELSPGEVRKKLGRAKYDPIYGLFSKLGPHSTFSAVQTKVAKNIKPSAKGNLQFNMWFGGSPFEHNIVWLNAFAIYAIYNLILQVMRSFDKFLNEDECMDILKQSCEEMRAYISDHFLIWARNNNLGVAEMEDSLKDFDWDKMKPFGTTDQS